MKELSFDKMEKIEGGLKAGCAVAGFVSFASLCFVWTGAGAVTLAGALLSSAAMGCFDN